MPPKETPAERAARIAAKAREREISLRRAAAERTKLEAPELYALAQRLKGVFGAGTKIRYVRFPDGSTWGTPFTDEGVVVIASSSPAAGGKA